MSEHLPENESSELEAALRTLAPVPARIDRDGLMFRAGQASVAGRRWLWPSATGVLAATVLILATFLAFRPAAEPGTRTIFVHAPMPAPASHVPVQSPSRAPPETPTALTEDKAAPMSDLAYLRLQKLIMRHGVDALPSLPEAGPPANEPPLTLNRLLGINPVTEPAGLFDGWRLP